MTPEQHDQVSAALLSYWTSLDEATSRQQQRALAMGNHIDVGGRAGATSGGHLDRVAQLLARVCIDAGAPIGQVYYKAPADDPLGRANTATGYTLPGYFRPTKQWDLVVYHDGNPIVVIELKSQKGPSYGNNANNRAEEAIGNAVDLQRARDSGLIPGQPWTGYVFVIEDDEKSRMPRGNRDRGQFPKDSAFSDWSYVDRVKLLCQRLVEDGRYSAAWAVATARPPNFSWREPDEVASGYTAFVRQMTDHIANHHGSPS